MEVHLYRWRRALALGLMLSFILPVLSQAEDEEFEIPVADNTATADIEPLGPFGGDLWDVAVDSTNNMVYTVAKDSPNGFYRSSDAGENWTGLRGVDYGGGMAVEVNSDSGAVYVAFNNGLMKSTDGGETFTRLSRDTSVALLYANGILMNGSNENPGSVLVSSDEGVSFDTVAFTSDTSQTAWDIDYSAAADSYFVLAYGDTNVPHVYQTTTAGASWTEITTPNFTENVSEARFAVNPIDADNWIITGGYNEVVYYTLTGESGWTATSLETSGVTFDHTGRAWLAENYSDDGGVTWINYDDDNTSSALGGHNVTVDPANENIVYADGMPGLSKSVDRGVTWSDINEGISGVTITDISQASDKDIVWAAAYNGIAKTENFTAETPTWQFPVLEEPGTGIWTNPTNPEVVVVGIIGGIKRSEDGGASWSDNLVSDLIDSSSNVDEIIADVATPTTLYAAVSNGDPNQPKTGAVLLSTDQGETWEDMNLLDDGSAQTITQASTGELYVGIGAESDVDGVTGIYKYSDGNWEKLTNAPDQDIVKIIADPENDQVIYAVAGLLYNNGAEDSFGFYKSTDAGDTWTQVTDGLTSMRNYTSLALQTSTTPNTLYVGAENIYGQGTLLKSSDAGETWATLYTGLQDETFYTLLFDGVTLGSSRGLYDIKSKAKVTVKAKKKKVVIGHKAVLTITLKDNVTDAKLKNKKVVIFKKTKSGFKKITTARTSTLGKVKVKIKIKTAKRYKFKVRWAPKDMDAEEYILANSSSVKIRGIK